MVKLNRNFEINPKFLSDKECEWLIEYHKKNYLKLPRDLNYSHNGTDIINISKIDHEKFRFIQSRLCHYIKEEFDYFAYPNYFELVKWPTGTSQDLHKDFDEHVFTSIIYLNNDFEGGETVVAGSKVEPWAGRMVTFRGNKLDHKVLKVTKGTRYTIPVWYLKYDSPDY
jgi:hypothetical protein